MASNLKLIDDCVKDLKRIVSIVDDSEEGQILHKTMSELRLDIGCITKELHVVGKSIEKLQTEVNHVLFRWLAKLTQRPRLNLNIICKAAIPPLLLF